VLQISNLTKRYGGFTALSGVSFSICPGEVLGLIGPNGSGKTTLFECLGGVLPPDGGRVVSDGRALSAAERSAILFYLPDGIAPWPAQNVRWALDFTLGFWAGGVGPRSLDRGVRPEITREQVVRQFDLEPLLDSPIGTLSKGQRKRALLAIGLLMPHPVLLADEPFDGLDLRQSRDVARTLRSHTVAGRTMLLSIHQITDAARVCDRFVLLSGGRVRGEGTLEELSATAAARGQPSGDLEEVFLALT
jgi:ABC-type multidrug transport system ATPase subunit